MSNQWIVGIKNLVWSRLIALSVALFLCSNTFAKDLGKLQKDFLIAEPDLLLALESKMQDLVASGGWDEIRWQMQKNAEKYVKRPPATPNILLNTTSPRAFYYKATTKMPVDIKDALGNVVVAKGAVADPLQYMQLAEDLIFVDADNAQQLNWASSKKGKIILVNGSLQTAYDALKRYIYFDQNGMLTQKLGIEQVPAMVSQVGANLLVEEIKLEA